MIVLNALSQPLPTLTSSQVLTEPTPWRCPAPACVPAGIRMSCVVVPRIPRWRRQRVTRGGSGKDTAGCSGRVGAAAGATPRGRRCRGCSRAAGSSGEGGIQCSDRALFPLPRAQEGQGGTQLPLCARAAATSPSPPPRRGHTLRGAANWDVNKRPIPISSTKSRSRSYPLLQGCTGRSMNPVSLHRHLVNNSYHFSSNNSSISV